MWHRVRFLQKLVWWKSPVSANCQRQWLMFRLSLIWCSIGIADLSSSQFPLLVLVSFHGFHSADHLLPLHQHVLLQDVSLPLLPSPQCSWCWFCLDFGPCPSLHSTWSLREILFIFITETTTSIVITSKSHLYSGLHIQLSYWTSLPIEYV